MSDDLPVASSNDTAQSLRMQRNSRQDAVHDLSLDARWSPYLMSSEATESRAHAASPYDAFGSSGVFGFENCSNDPASDIVIVGPEGEPAFFVRPSEDGGDADARFALAVLNRRRPETYGVSPLPWSVATDAATYPDGMEAQFRLVASDGRLVGRFSKSCMALAFEVVRRSA